MGKTTIGRAGDLAWAGEKGIIVSSGAVALATTAQSNLGSIIAPCDLTVVQADVNVVDDTTATSGGALNFGTYGDPDSLLDAYPVVGADEGHVDITSATQWVGTTITKGQVVGWQCEVASAGNGVVCGTVVLWPTSVVG